MVAVCDKSSVFYIHTGPILMTISTHSANFGIIGKFFITSPCFTFLICKKEE